MSEVSTPLEHVADQVVPPRVVGGARGWLGRGRLEVTSQRRSQRRLLIDAGRLAVAFTPPAFIVGTAHHGADALLSAVLFAVVWFVAISRVYSAPWALSLALGAPFASALGAAVGLLAATAIAFWVPGVEAAPRDLILMAAGVFVLSTLFEAFVIRRVAPPGRILVVGCSRAAFELGAALAADERSPFDCAGFVYDDTDKLHALDGVDPPLANRAGLVEAVTSERPDVVVLAGEEPADDARALSDLLDHSGELSFRVVGAQDFHEHAFGRVPVSSLPPTWFMSLLHLNQRLYPRLLKRGLDLLLAGVGLLLAIPLLIVIAVAVRLSGPGPVLFRQLRLGEGGRTFTLVKFRTMIDGAEKPGEAVWAHANDARVTRLGRLLRKARLDELPQLWNVLRGEMSIVGPRPERPEFLPLLEMQVPFWTRRHLVKPGITGWAQVSHGYTASADETSDKLSYDLYYVKNRSLLLDLAIVAKTIRTVLSGSGAR
jgi:exopolysaccharide biosynthesis polyprenyl glycosylphosphotransferase